MTWKTTNFDLNSISRQPNFVSGVDLHLQSSGNEAFDRSAEQAVRKAARFDVPEDPALFEAHFRRFQMLFKPEDLLR